MENTITDFGIILTQCELKNKGELTEQELFAWFDETYELKNYVGINIKYVTSDMIKLLTFNNIIKYTPDGMVIEDYINYAISKDMYILCDYIGVYSSHRNHTTEKYNNFVQSGLYNYIISKIGNDYNKYDKIVDEFCGITLLPIIRSIRDNISMFTTEENIGSMKNKFSDFAMKLSVDYPDIANFLKTKVQDMQSKVQESEK